MASACGFLSLAGCTPLKAHSCSQRSLIMVSISHSAAKAQQASNDSAFAKIKQLALDHMTTSPRVMALVAENDEQLRTNPTFRMLAFWSSREHTKDPRTGRTPI